MIQTRRAPTNLDVFERVCAVETAAKKIETHELTNEYEYELWKVGFPKQVFNQEGFLTLAKGGNHSVATISSR